MAVALILRGVDKTRRHKMFTFEPTFSGSYANPEVLDFTLATNPEYRPFSISEAPVKIIIENPVAGFSYESVLGTTAKNSTLKIYDPNGAVTLGGGLITYTAGAGDIKGSTAPAGTEAAADQAAGPVNPALLIAEATFTAIGATAYSTIAKQPDVARNLVFVVHNTTGGALNLFNGDMTIAVVGTFRGNAQTENVTWTSTAGNQSVAAAKFRFLAGVKPFDTITSIQITNGGAGTLSLSVAPGSKLGLPRNFATASESDIKKLYKNAADLVITGTADVTNFTVNFGTMADGDDCSVEYMALNSGLPSTAPGAVLLAASPYPADITTEDVNMRITAVFRF